MTMVGISIIFDQDGKVYGVEDFGLLQTLRQNPHTKLTDMKYFYLPQTTISSDPLIQYERFGVKAYV